MPCTQSFSSLRAVDLARVQAQNMYTTHETTNSSAVYSSLSDTALWFQVFLFSRELCVVLLAERVDAADIDRGGGPWEA